MTRRPAGPFLLLVVCCALAACAWMVLGGKGGGSRSAATDVTPGSHPEDRSGLAQVRHGDDDPVRGTRTAEEAQGFGIPGKPVVDLAGSRHRGFVLRAEDEQPLAGAGVILRADVRGCRFPELEPDPILQVTGPDGSFAVPPEGSWDVTVRAPQRVTLQGVVQDRDGTLAASPEKAVFRLPRGHLVRGRVTGSQGTPPAGTDLTVNWLQRRVEHSAFPRASTDENGWFTLGPMPLERAFLVVVTELDTPDFHSLPVRLTDREPEPILVPWEAIGSLDVVVLDARGRPAEEVWVELHPPRPCRIFQKKVWEDTDERGRVEVRGLACGSYRLQVTHWKTHEVFHEQWIEVTGERPFLDLVVSLDRAVPSPAERDGVEEVEDEEPADESWQEVPVRASFRDGAGRDLAVTLMPVETRGDYLCALGEVDVDPTSSGEEEDHRLELRDPTSTRVLVAAPGRGARLVALDQVTGNGMVVLRAGRTVRGRLCTEDGRPIPYLPLQAAPWVLHQADEWQGPEAFVAQTWAAEDGTFEFLHLTREKLVLRVGSEELDGQVLDEKVLPAGAADVDLGVLVIPGW